MHDHERTVKRKKEFKARVRCWAENLDVNVAWLGEAGFPYGLAAIQKTIILGDALTKAGIKVGDTVYVGEYELEWQE